MSTERARALLPLGGDVVVVVDVNWVVSAVVVVAVLAVVVVIWVVTDVVKVVVSDDAVAVWIRVVVVGLAVDRDVLVMVALLVSVLGITLYV